MISGLNYHQAVRDFQQARHKAEIQRIFSRLRGESNKLLSYEEVRQKLKALEGNTTTLKEIPLDAIIGSVGRYTDFTRDFLPQLDSDKSRWITVMEKTLDSSGLPPIEVYQIGETYFVKDGNHRVSVARQLGATHIQAYVTNVQSRVPITPDTSPDEMILKAEMANFLEQTRIDELHPGADLTLTEPGQYPILEEHISVHRYFMGIESGHSVPYAEAVTHWYDQVYLPVVEIIKERGVLGRFPHRTQTDLYLWLSKHKAHLEESLGWHLDTEVAVDNLVNTYAHDFHQTISKLTTRILDLVIPDPLETGPPPGIWRKGREDSAQPVTLFGRILVAVGGDPEQWLSLEQAIPFAQRENALLQGLHVIAVEKPEFNQISSLKDVFETRCSQSGLQGELAIERGGIARLICDRAVWADLVIAQLAHPPGDRPIERLESGLRTIIRRCSSPILVVPRVTSRFERVLLAYTDSPKAREAMYIGAYLAGKWGVELTVLSIVAGEINPLELQEPVRQYLENQSIQAKFILEESDSIPESIIKKSIELCSDMILIGGYKANPLVEVLTGSVVDVILRKTSVPVMICR